MLTTFRKGVTMIRVILLSVVMSGSACAAPEAVSRTGSRLPATSLERNLPAEEPSPAPHAHPDIRCWTMGAITTAYNFVRGQSGSEPCVGASGEDLCALHDRGDQSCAGEFPFGTILIVPDYGACTVRDRVGKQFRHRWHVDLGFGRGDRVAAALAWGRRPQVIIVCAYQTGGEVR